MKKKWMILIIAFLVSLVLGFGSYFNSRQYEITKPHIGNLTEAVYGLGKVRSNKRFEVIVGVMSGVSRRFVNEGDLVDKGDPLVKFETGALFRSPFRGTVTLAKLYEGETALPGVPVLRVEDLNNRYIELSLEQTAILRVKVGMPAKISFESLRGQVLNGRVSALFPREDEFLVRLSVDNLENNVLPGMSADVSIEVGNIENALLIPLKAIQNGMVSVRRNNRWQKIKVEVGHIDGLWAEVKDEALKQDDEIRFKGAD